MKVNKMFPSKFLTKDDVKDFSQPVVFRIDRIEIEEVQNEDGKEDKPVLYFDENDSKPLILNKTNAETLAAEFGPDSDSWVGSSIELFVDPNIRFGKQRIGGIRVRLPEAPKEESIQEKKAPF